MRYELFIFISVLLVIALAPAYVHAGTLVEDCTACGCDQGYICDYDTKVCVQACADGTRYKECSPTQPLYCSGGVLVPRSDICGCPPGQTPQPDGTCEASCVEDLGGDVCSSSEICQSQWLPNAAEDRCCATQCVGLCEDQGGFICDSFEQCQGSYLPAAEGSNVCCNVPCTPTCTSQGGEVCLSTQVCLGTTISTPDAAACCLGSCENQPAVTILPAAHYPLKQSFIVDVKVIRQGTSIPVQAAPVGGEIKNAAGNLVSQGSGNTKLDGIAALTFQAINSPGSYIITACVQEAGQSFCGSQNILLTDSMNMVINSPLVQFTNKPFDVVMTITDPNGNKLGNVGFLITASVNNVPLPEPTVVAEEFGVYKFNLDVGLREGLLRLDIESRREGFAPVTETVEIELKRPFIQIEHDVPTPMKLGTRPITILLKNPQGELTNVDTIEATITDPNAKVTPVTFSSSSTGRYTGTYDFTVPENLYILKVKPIKTGWIIQSETININTEKSTPGPVPGGIDFSGIAVAVVIILLLTFGFIWWRRR